MSTREGSILFIRIYGTKVSSQEEHVVRWCRECGAVVVDLDFDGRTAPGRIMEMIAPKRGG